MSVVQTVSCGACGANLDLANERNGRVQCAFCGAWSVFTAGTHDPVALRRYPPPEDADVLALVAERLRKRALPEARSPQSALKEGVYRMREVTIEGGPNQVVFLSNKPWYAHIGRHRVGLKMQGEGPDVLRMTPSVERLAWSEPDTPSPEPPDDAPRAAEGMTERVGIELRRRNHQDSFFLLWDGPVEVVRVPFVEVAFELVLERKEFVGEPAPDERWWVRVGPDGKVVDERLPRRKLQLPAIGRYLVFGTIAGIALIIGGALVVSLIAALIPCLLGVVGSL